MRDAHRSHDAPAFSSLAALFRMSVDAQARPCAHLARAVCAVRLAANYSAPDKTAPESRLVLRPGRTDLTPKDSERELSYLGGLPSVTITKLPLFTASPVSISRVFTWMTIVVLLTLTTRALETAN